MRVLGIGCRRIPIPDRGCDQALHDRPEARTELLSSGNGSHVLGERRLDFATGTHMAVTSGRHIGPSPRALTTDQSASSTLFLRIATLLRSCESAVCARVGHAA